MKIINSQDHGVYKYCDECGIMGSWFMEMADDHRTHICRPCFEKAVKLWQEHDDKEARRATKATR